MADPNGTPLGRPERRGVVHPDLAAVLAQAVAERDAAVRRFDSVRVVLESHTLWEHPDGRDLCDFDGESWPCNTLGSLGYVYGVEVQGW